MASPGTLSGNAQQVGDLMYHLLQMKAEQLLTQAQAQTSTLKLSGHLAAAAVHSNALQPWQRQGAETDGAAEIWVLCLLSGGLPASFLYRLC